MANVVDDLPAGRHLATVNRVIVNLFTVIPTNSSPQAPPGGGNPTGIPTRPASGQLWPRGDGVPRSG